MYYTRSYVNMTFCGVCTRKVWSKHGCGGLWSRLPSLSWPLKIGDEQGSMVDDQKHVTEENNYYGELPYVLDNTPPFLPRYFVPEVGRGLILEYAVTVI